MGKTSINSSDAAVKQHFHYLNVNKIVLIPLIMGNNDSENSIIHTKHGREYIYHKLQYKK